MPSRFLKVTLSILSTLVLVLVGFATVFAQATASGSLSGTVLDKNQAAIKGATVTATNKATGQTRTATTNDSGEYKIDLLPAGNYDIKVNASGFADAASENVELLVGQTNTLNFTMNPGGVTGTVTVTAGETELVSKEKTDISMNITPRDVQDLPLNGRDLANLAYLAPGAKPVDSYDPTKNRIAIVGINGSSGRNLNVTVNGIDNKDNTVGGPVMQFPLGAIQEFYISTQRFSAANGRSEGAAVNVITKSGSNNWHGSLYFFDTETSMNANDFISKQNGQPTPEFSRQQFGGSIGGHVRKDKDFFFFTLERQRENTSIPVPTDALTELNLVKSLGAQPAATVPTPYFDWRYTGRYDHRFNSAHSLFLTYSSQTNEGLNDQFLSVGGRADLTAGNFTTNSLILSNVTLNSVFSPAVVNAITVGYQYWNNVIDTKNKVPTFVFAPPIGAPGSLTFGTNTNVPQ